MQDLQSKPTYTIPEAAYFLGISPVTLRSWVRGRTYVSWGKHHVSEPLIQMADPERYLLSFINIVEAHVLSALRKTHQIKMHKIRPAIEFLKEKYKTEHPLAEAIFETDGLELFTRDGYNLINISRKGQLAAEQFLKHFLKRIVRDETGRPLRLYPVRDLPEGDDNLLMIDPQICFGRMVLKGSGIPIDEIESRYEAGESLEDIAEDYGCKKEELEKALAAA